MSDNDVFLDSFWLPAAALKLKAPAVRRFAEKGSALDSAARRGTELSASETEDYSGFKVALRIRPLMPTERAIYESGKLCVEPVEIDGVPAIKLRRQTPSGDIRTESYRLHNVFGPEASQHDVYDGVVRRCVLSALAGINASVLAYGCTGTGKTHTMIGTKRDGVIPQALADLFASADRDQPAITTTIILSFVQIYKEIVTDLLDDSRGPLKIVEDGGHGTALLGVSEHEITSVGQAMPLLERGYALRITAHTERNEVSSRSHAVVRLRVLRASSTAGGVLSQQAELNLVDHAGCERTPGDEKGGERFEERIKVNQSLLTLCTVIAALTANADGRASHIPYRNSKLTRLLQNSLGGNCSTCFVSTISPDVAAADDTLRTIQVACRATHIKSAVVQNVKVTLTDGTVIPGRNAKERKCSRDDDEDEATAAASSEPPQVASTDDEYVMVRTCAGAVAVRLIGWLSSPQGPAVVLLHGYPSNICEFEYAFPALLASRARIVGIDMPGFGRSPGQRFGSRSELNTAKHGPVDVVKDVLKELRIPKAGLYGYDWGAGIALSLALTSPKLVASLFLHNVTYSEQSTELACVNHNVTLAWTKNDAFHPESWAKRLKSRLKNCKLHWFGGRSATVDPHDAVPELAGVWVKSLPRSKSTHKSDSGGVLSTHGATLALTAPAPMPTLSAVAEFKEAWLAGRLPQLYGAMIGKGDAALYSTALRMFQSLPELSPVTLRDPTLLVDSGIWPVAPKHWEALQSCSKYRVGQRVLVRASVSNDCSRPKQYLQAAGADTDELYVTPFAIITALDSDAGTARIRLQDGRDIVSSLRDLDNLNGPQSFRTPEDMLKLPPKRDGGYCLQFEDGVKCDYSKPLMKARLCEMALAMAGVVEAMDFADDGVYAAQLECISYVRRIMNITPLQGGVDRRRDARTHSVAKLITYGQGHCHGMTSTTVACLLAFAHVLGVIVKYRAGQVVAAMTMRVSNSVDQHHWVEVTLKPSNESFVLDPSYDCGGRDAPLPMLTAYNLSSSEYTGGQALYPNCKPLPFMK